MKMVREQNASRHNDIKMTKEAKFWVKAEKVTRFTIEAQILNLFEKKE